MPKQLKFRRLDQRGPWAHSARASDFGLRPEGPHSHDFYELFWIERGQLVEHGPAGPELLAAGDLRWVNPTRTHAFSLAGPGGGASLVNVAVPASLAKDLQRRLAWRWQGRARLNSTALAEIGRDFDRLAHSSKERLDTEGFLMDVLRQVQGLDVPLAAGPPWLHAALATLKEPASFTQGSGPFFAACGRSPEHATRECRRWTGKSPSQLLTQARMQWAARQLESSHMEIVEIALACGLENLGHFYSLFKRVHGRTPRQWRLGARQSAGLEKYA